MKQSIKRLTALILAMAMSLSLLSANVWAAEEPLEDGSVSAQSSEESAAEETSVEEVAPSEEEAPAEESAPQEEKPPAEEETPTEESASAEEVVPEEVESAEESAPTEEEAPTEEPSPDEETSVEESEHAEEETSLTPQGTVASGTCGENVNWALDDTGKLTISGTGPMYNYYEAYLPWGYSIKSVDIQSGVTKIGHSAFDYCRSLASVTISSDVSSIDNSAFRNCTSLTSISIPNGVTTIGSGAFRDCTSLADIIVPNSVTSIGEDAFSGTPWIENMGDYVVVNGILLEYRGTDQDLIIPDGVTTIGSYLFYETEKNIKTVNLPDSVTTIGKSAFNSCGSLTSINIPDGVTTIGDSAFAYCGRLTSLVIPDSVTSIGDRAFRNCRSLTSANIPNSITTIGEYMFYGCEKLQNMAIPNGVTSIGQDAFGHCISMTSIQIPNSVGSIGKLAFEYCNGISSITIPKSVIDLGENVFANCEKLKSINVDSDNPNYYSDDGVLYDKKKTTLLCCPGGKEGEYVILNGVGSIAHWAFGGCSSLTGVRIPDSVTTIEDWAFRDCNCLTSVCIPNGVTSIEANTFYNCGSLASVSIPESVKVIQEYAFSHCTSLTSVDIPNGVESIWDRAFADCSSLTNVNISESVRNLGSTVFYNCPSLKSVTIPATVTRIDYYTFGFIQDHGNIKPVDNFTIFGYTGSAAQKYAIENNIQFVDLATHTHTWSAGTVTTPATCKSEGVRTVTCTECHQTTTQVIAKNSNNHVGGTEIRNRKAATCGEAGYTGDTYCLGCNTKLSSGSAIPATGNHTWDAGSVTTQPTTTAEGVRTFTCTVCHRKKTEPIAKLPKMENTITCGDIFTKNANVKKNQTFNLGASANGAPLSYQSNEKQVTVKNGKVTIKKGYAGKATITITAAETDAYLSATKIVTVSVKPVAAVKVDKKKKTVTVSWTKCTVGKGYEAQIAQKKDFKKVAKKVKVKKKATASTSIKGLKPGTYYVRVRMLNGKKSSDWSKAKTFKVAK